MAQTLERLADAATAMNADLATQVAALHPQCFDWAVTCCHDRTEDAEDVLHDTYVAVLEQRLRYDGRSSLRTWLFGVIRHKARARSRRQRLREWLGIRNVARIAAPSSAPAPDDDAIATDRRERTRRALQQLSPRQREVLLLVFYHDLTVDEAAGVMRVSVGSARTHYARGKERMAHLLEEVAHE